MQRSEIARWFHTIRYLRWRQLLAYCPRPSRRLVQLAKMPIRPPLGRWQNSIAREQTWRGDRRVCILNQEREVTCWESSKWPRLWTYHLHYFDSPHEEWIQRWIRENKAGHGVGWDPYPTSRRIVNWIKYILGGGVLDSAALASLTTQTEHLSRNIEHRVLGNHVISNAKALIFAGLFFQGGVAQRWYSLGTRLLSQQMREQILPDGGHFERSPMYHSIVLEDLLDLVNLVHTYGIQISDLENVGERMCGWLRIILHPDGQIPFFNDATFGVAASPAELFAYASLLGVLPGKGILRESGYIRLENEGTVVFFDTGLIGPDYQPGHGHADTLSFEMSSGGKRVIVNSGISTYERGEQRDWERGSAAHNTVRIDGINQSEVWHNFRVGRRARPFDVRTDHMLFAEGAHDGYKRQNCGVVHRRGLKLIGKDLEVTDSLEGAGSHQIELFFHLHPEAATPIQLDPALCRSKCTTTYHPGFYLSVPKTTITGRYDGPLPAKFKSYISA
jgi:uncharacterized heparinase superfamily protein